MNITDVRIRKVGEEGKMKAIASVTFDDEFVVHDIKVIEGRNGLFIAMPSRKMSDGDFRDIAHPLLSETRNRIKDAIHGFFLLEPVYPPVRETYDYINEFLKAGM